MMTQEQEDANLLAVHRADQLERRKCANIWQERLVQASKQYFSLGYNRRKDEEVSQV